MKYNDLSIHQRITLKGFITSKRERERVGVSNDAYFDGLYALAILNKSFVESIDLFLGDS